MSYVGTVAARRFDAQITSNFARFHQRDDIFCRAWWDPSIRSPDTESFFKASRDEATARRGEGFQQRDFALRNASWAVSDDYANRNFDPHDLREGYFDPLAQTRPLADEQEKFPDSHTAAAHIKAVAKLFGADLVGITLLDRRFLYEASVDARTMEAKPNAVPEFITHVIILACEMPLELVQMYPSATAGAATGLGYSREVHVCRLLSQYVRNLGYEAIASINDTALNVPLAIKAGLGEYGRNQTLITFQFGPRIRLAKVFTNLPLACDQPIAFGVHETCQTCTRCSRACPPKALPFGDPQEGALSRSNIRGVIKWTSDAEKCFGYWAKMRADCAICIRVCPYNRDFSKFPSKLIRFLLRTRLRSLGLWLSDRLRSGVRRRPSVWWRRIESSAGSRERESR
jgi:reductive dehalogenase